MEAKQRLNPAAGVEVVVLPEGVEAEEQDAATEDNNNDELIVSKKSACCITLSVTIVDLVTILNM